MTDHGLLGRLRHALWAEHLTGLPLLKPYRDGFIRELDAAMTIPPPMTAQTPAERQEARRKRLLMDGITEVRGVFLHESQHAALKEYARKMQKRWKPEPSQKPDEQP